MDQNGDNAIDPTNDRTIVGYRTPSYRFSVNNNVTWKNFTLSVFVNSIQGGKKYYLADNAEMINPLFYMQQRMNNSAINAYWRPDAPTTNTTGMYNVPLRQSGIYQSRSFVRLQDVSITYRLPKRYWTRSSFSQHRYMYRAKIRMYGRSGRMGSGDRSQRYAAYAKYHYGYQG